MPSAALDIHDLHLDYGPVRALDGLDFRAERGQVSALLGPNGAGKTSMIRCCTGLAKPSAGTISIVDDVPGSDRVRTAVGCMPQSAGAWSAIGARELLRHIAGLYANPLPVDTLLELFGIAHVARTPYRRLSGGQQQSLNLAGAIIGRPELVFLDEPTAGLDLHVQRRVWQVIEQLRDSGVAVVLCTHVMDEAAALADTITIIDHGTVVRQGTPSELTADGQSLSDVFLAATQMGGTAADVH